MSLRVCAVSGGRADYSLLSMPLLRLRDDPAFALLFAVTGQHMVEGADGSLAAIAADGLRIDARIDMRLGGDSPREVTQAMGRAVIAFAELFDRERPDLVLLLGDRYEILAVAQAALVARCPVAHICGGDLTEGALDDAIRHAITKLAHLHFVTNESAARRVRQLGEDPARIHLVGSPGIDRLLAAPRLTREDFFSCLGVAPRRRNLLITFHPVTLAEDSLSQACELLAALEVQGADMGLLFTGVNADAEGRALESLITDFCKGRDNATLFPSLGPELYYSAITHCDAVVGNSSSGLYEAPSLGRPTVNIGDRQSGRLRAASVIDCPPEREAIASGIARALSLDCSGVVNPYGNGHASEGIVQVLKDLGNPRDLLRKRFHDLETAA